MTASYMQEKLKLKNRIILNKRMIEAGTEITATDSLIKQGYFYAHDVEKLKRKKPSKKS